MNARFRMALLVAAAALVVGVVAPALAGGGGGAGRPAQESSKGTGEAPVPEGPGDPAIIGGGTVDAPPPDGGGGSVGAPGSSGGGVVIDGGSGVVFPQPGGKPFGGPANEDFGIRAPCPATGIPCEPGLFPGPEHTVTVTGSAVGRSDPDEAVIGLGVRTEADDAEAAVQANADRMDEVFAALARLGIPRADIATTSVSVYPGYEPDGTTSSTFVAENQVSVVVRDLGRVGEVIDRSVAAGANLTTGVYFRLSDQSAAVEQGLAEAVGDARGKAEAMSAAAGVSLGNVVAMAESGSSYPVYAEAGFAEDGARTPIAPAPVETYVTVTVSWELVTPSE